MAPRTTSRTPARSLRGWMVVAGVAAGIVVAMTALHTADADEYTPWSWPERAATTPGPGLPPGRVMTPDGGVPPGPRPTTSLWAAGANTAFAPSHHLGELRTSAASDPATVALSAMTRLPADLVARLESDPGIVSATVVRVGIRDLVRTVDRDGATVDAVPSGWWLPVEVLAVDPTRYAAIMEVPEVLALGPGEALLSESSASVRRLGVGGRLRFADGVEVRVAGVLPDALVGAAEVLVTTASPLAPTWAAYALAVRADADDDEVLDRFRSVPGGRMIQVRGGEVPVLRHAPDLMAPARLKRVFGEYPVSHAPDRWFEQGRSWQEQALVRQDYPIIGPQTCHALMVAPLTAALDELVARGLDHLLDPGDVGGCWAPRTQGGRTPSSHAWGISVDLNVHGNLMGATPTMPMEVVEVFTALGFAWGGDWPVPDGMHFELVVDRPPGERWLSAATTG